MAFKPQLTSTFGRKVAFTPEAIAKALSTDFMISADEKERMAHVFAADPILVGVYRMGPINKPVFSVNELTTFSVVPKLREQIRQHEIATLVDITYSTKEEAIIEFIKLVKRPSKVHERRTLKSCILIPPRSGVC